MTHSDLGLDVGQANELKLAFRRHDWNNELIKRLCETDLLGDVLDILRGDSAVVSVKRVLDLSAAPALKEGEVIVKHLKQGKIPLSELRVALIVPSNLHYTTDTLLMRKDNHHLFKLVYNETTLGKPRMMPQFMRLQKPANICLRDFYLENPHLVPERWTWCSEPILFWGTVCKNEHCSYVPGMKMDYGKWKAYGRRIDADMSHTHYTNPCVVFAPPPS